MEVPMGINNITLLEDEYFNENKIPYCKNCHTPRYFIREDFCVRCKCQCQMQEIDMKEQLMKQAIKQEYLKELKEKSLLGERYKNATFEKIEIINEQHKKIIDDLKEYCDNFKNDSIGIYLYGSTGAGKTMLTASMIDILNSKFIECYFTNINKIKQEILSLSLVNQKKFIEKLSRVPVLFIDDFATENFKKNGEDNWVQDIVYDIVNTRYNNMLPIVYTSNYSLKECLEQKGILEKTIDRIFESTIQIKLELPSYRLKTKNKFRR